MRDGFETHLRTLRSHSILSGASQELVPQKGPIRAYSKSSFPVFVPWRSSRLSSKAARLTATKRAAKMDDTRIAGDNLRSQSTGVHDRPGSNGV